jgi:hypothetical protein
MTFDELCPPYTGNGVTLEICTNYFFYQFNTMMAEHPLVIPIVLALIVGVGAILVIDKHLDESKPTEGQNH